MVLGNFQYQSVLQIWMVIKQVPNVLSVGTGGGMFGYFSVAHFTSSFPPYLWDGGFDMDQNTVSNDNGISFIDSK